MVIANKVTLVSLLLEIRDFGTMTQCAGQVPPPKRSVTALCRTIRWPIQAALAVATLGIYTLFKNFHLLEVDHAAITAVVKTSEQAEVAAGFYQKMLDRNLVLRQILGPDGDGGYCFTDQVTDLLPPQLLRGKGNHCS